jgi:flagellar biosynthesis protein FliP
MNLRVILLPFWIFVSLVDCVADFSIGTSLTRKSIVIEMEIPPVLIICGLFLFCSFYFAFGLVEKKVSFME